MNHTSRNACKHVHIHDQCPLSGIYYCTPRVIRAHWSSHTHLQKRPPFWSQLYTSILFCNFILPILTLSHWQNLSSDRQSDMAKYSNLLLCSSTYKRCLQDQIVSWLNALTHTHTQTHNVKTSTDAVAAGNQVQCLNTLEIYSRETEKDDDRKHFIHFAFLVHRFQCCHNLEDIWVHVLSNNGISVKLLLFNCVQMGLHAATSIIQQYWDNFYRNCFAIPDVWYNEAVLWAPACQNVNQRSPWHT